MSSDAFRFARAVTDGKPTASSGIRFSPNIELGHILQAIVMMVALGGWALAGYFTVQQQLNQHAAKMEVFQQRLVAYETSSAELRENLKISVAETRNSLAKISDQIADLRTLVAGQWRHDAPRR